MAFSAVVTKSAVQCPLEVLLGGEAEASKTLASGWDVLFWAF